MNCKIDAMLFDSMELGSSAEEASLKRSMKLRDLSVNILRAVQNKSLSAEVALQLEQLTPQLERHVALQRKLKQWHLSEDFDSIGLGYHKSAY